MNDLKGKVAVVTGASKGIGAGIAKAMAEAGAAVVVNYVGSKEAAQRVSDEIVSKGGRAIAVQGDVSKAADVRKLFAETKAAFGTIEILVNNAGIGSFATVEAVTEEQYRRLFDTNVLGTVLTIQEALKHFGPTRKRLKLTNLCCSLVQMTPTCTGRWVSAGPRKESMPARSTPSSMKCNCELRTGCNLGLAI